MRVLQCEVCSALFLLLPDYNTDYSHKHAAALLPGAPKTLCMQLKEEAREIFLFHKCRM